MELISSQRLIKIATQLAMFVAATLVVCKFYAWICTHSISLKASLIDSILDLGASFVNFLAVRQALKPADEDHRFGHGKAEAISGLAQATFIAGSAVWLCLEVFQQLYNPVLLKATALGSWVMVFASLLTFLLILFQNYTVKKTQSIAIQADSLHYKTDLYTNLAVLFSLNMSSFFPTAWLDTVIGGCIAVYILRTSYEIGVKSVHILMDRELPEETREKITALVLQNPTVLGIHELRTRSYGQYDFIQFHLDLNKELSLWEAHNISDAVELSILAEFPHAEIIIHQDPI